MQILKKLLLAAAVPLVFVMALEGLLRLFGSGYNPRFVIPYELADGSYGYRDNPAFAYTFFPQIVARHPAQLRIPAAKKTGELRVLVLGGSAAFGDPQPEFGFPVLLEARLRRMVPDRTFRVINGAMTSINSHVLPWIYRDCRVLKPDAVIVLAGNNEVVGPFGPTAVLTPSMSSPAFVRTAVRFRRTRLGQWMSRQGGASELREWRGMEMFLGSSFGFEDPAVRAVRAAFEKNLQHLAEACRDDSVPMILMTVPVNLADCPPLEIPDRVEPVTQSIPDSIPDSVDWYAGDVSEAVRLFREGETALAAGDPDRAAASFSASRDADRQRFRADSGMQEVIRRVGSTMEGGRWIDAEQAFHDRSGGLPGRDLFVDHVHYTAKGNLLLSELASIELVRALKLSPSGPPPGDAADLEDTGYGLLAEQTLHTLMIDRFKQLPFSTQYRQHDRMLAWWKSRLELEQRLDRSAIEAEAEVYRKAWEADPADTYAATWYAGVLRYIGRPGQAADVLGHTAQLNLYMPDVFYRWMAASGEAGQLDHALQELKRRGDWRDAEKARACREAARILLHYEKTEPAGIFLEEALTYEPTSADALHMMADIALRNNDPARALHAAGQAMEQDPHDGMLQAIAGAAASATGDPEAAGRYYREAVGMLPLNHRVLYLYGTYLKEQGQYSDAARVFGLERRLNPADPALLYHGIASLVRAGRAGEIGGWMNDAAQVAPNDHRFAMLACLLADDEERSALLEDLMDRQGRRLPDALRVFAAWMMASDPAAETYDPELAASMCEPLVFRGSSGHPFTRLVLASSYANAGRRSEAAQVLGPLERRDIDPLVSRMAAAVEASLSSGEPFRMPVSTDEDARRFALLLAGWPELAE